MSITINNGVSNIKATPGIIADDYANIPAATNVATGTIFIDTVGLMIYRSEAGGWFALGGGGGTPTIQQVVDTGNTIINNNILLSSSVGSFSTQLDNYSLFISNAIDVFTYSYNFFSCNNSTTGTTIKIDYSTPRILQSTFDNGIGEISIGIKLDFQNNFYYLGNNSSGIFINLDSQVYKFGDYDFGGANGTNILIDDAGSFISTRVAGSLEKGLYFDFINSLYKFGDFYATMNNTYLIINDATQKIELSNNLKSATAGGSAGQHLKINIGGTDYKIALLNP